MADTIDRPNGVYLRGFKTRLGQLLIAGNRADYDQGRMIEECRVGQYWRWWLWEDQDGEDKVGFAKFDHWCWVVLGFRRSKGDHLRKNYNYLSALGLDERGVTFSRAMRLGWNKLYMILRVAKNEETLIAWLDRVEANNTTWEELRAEVRWTIAEAERVARGDDAPEEGEEGSTPTPPERPAAKIRWPVVFESREATDIVLKAHARIQSRFDGDLGLGKALAMMATHYLATTPRDEEGGAAVEVEMMIAAFETNYGLRMAPAPIEPAGDTVAPRKLRPLS